jgi:integrin beta 2
MVCEEPQFFACANGLCVTRTRRCDGRNDCGDFSDELSCGKEEMTRVGTVAPRPTFCPAGYVRVADGSRCKSNSSVQPKIMFSNRYYIRLVDLQGNSEIFAKNQSNAVALGRVCQLLYFAVFFY